jgi:hypothetical protein
MPFVSKKQQKFAYSNPERFGGESGLKEWSEATDYKSLPESAEAEVQEGKTSRPKRFNYSPKVKAGYTKQERVA